MIFSLFILATLIHSDGVYFIYSVRVSLVLEWQMNKAKTLRSLKNKSGFKQRTTDIISVHIITLYLDFEDKIKNMQRDLQVNQEIT